VSLIAYYNGANECPNGSVSEWGLSKNMEYSMWTKLLQFFIGIM